VRVPVSGCRVAVPRSSLAPRRDTAANLERVTTTADDTGTLRADAERNRAKVLCAARGAFAELGLDAPLEEIARRAGVGIATLYRRFPTREALVAATATERMAQYAQTAEAALATADPWDGFATYVRQLAAMQVADRGLGDVMAMSFPDSDEFERHRDATYSTFLALIRRAQQAKVLRDDFVAEDFIMLMMANTGIIHAAGELAPQLSERLVSYLLQSFGTGAAGPLPPAPDPERLHGVMCR